MKKILVLVIAMILCYNMLPAETLNTIMMEATCKIEGQGSVGTGFIMGKPMEEDESKLYYTLVTADHVFSGIVGETCIITLRQKDDLTGWKKIRVPLRIRNGNRKLWTKHPDVDVAAMFVRLPKNAVRKALSTEHLVDDEKLIKWEISPGMELLCLGYPFGAEANKLGFPILRSGRIASYPLTPSKEMKSFLFDFTVFGGNSGGPVYFFEMNPTYGGSTRLGQPIYGILGIVVRERNITQKMQMIYESKELRIPLQLGEVLHASFIKELIDSMGFPSSDN